MADRQRTNKIILIVFGVLALLIAIVAIASIGNDSSKDTTDSANTSTADKAITDQITVTSQSVKAADGKTDYWFSVKNTSDKQFVGQVDISVYAGDRNLSTLSGVFDGVTIEPGLATSLKITADDGGDSFSYAIDKVKYDTKKPLTTE